MCGLPDVATWLCGTIGGMIKFGLAVFVGLSLAGCATATGPSAAPTTGASTPSATQAPTATPTASPTASPTPTPTPTPTEAAITALVISAADIELIDADGSAIDEFAYNDDADTVREALTSAFGSEPEMSTDSDGGTTDYYWEDFSFRAYDSATGANRTFYVVAEGASVGDIAIETADGIAVGDAEADVETVAFDNHTDDGGSETIEFYSLDKTAVDVAESTDGGDPAINFVRVWVPKPGTEITRIDAPIANYGE